MLPLSPPFRIAEPEDAAVLASLVNYAGEGLPLYYWSRLSETGQDPWEIGRNRQAAKAKEGQVIVVDVDGQAVASLTGYPIDAEPEPITDAVPPLFRPLVELENAAPGTWYVNVLACLPDHRGQGHGTALLRLAERLAGEAGLSAMSVIVADNNTGARRLYERTGYVERATRPCVREGWETETRSWILLVKPLPSAAAED